MPAQPTWFHRLEEILCELRKLETEYLDRHTIEKLFHVRERRARQLMAGLPCLQIGNAVGVNRQELIQRLEHTAAGERFHWEIARRTRVAESLEILRKHAAAQRIRVAVAADARSGPLVISLPTYSSGPANCASSSKALRIWPPSSSN